MKLVFVAALTLVLLNAWPARTVESQENPSVAGVIWEDVNADGVRQAHEPGLHFIYIELSPQDGGRGRFARTDEKGAFTFAGVTPGRYRLVVGTGGYFQTYPVRGGPALAIVNVGAQAVAGLEFGLHMPAHFAGFWGDVWIDAQAGGEFRNVRAFIGDKDCTGGAPILAPPGTAGYVITVIGADLMPGCGKDGEFIRFMVDGRPANETAIWRIRTSAEFPPYGYERMTLTVGPPFAYLAVTSTTPSGRTDYPRYDSVTAVINGVPCGSNIHGFGPSPQYISLPSTGFPSGCGVTGREVQLVLEDSRVVSTGLTWREGFLGEVEVPWVPDPGLLDDPAYYESVYGQPKPAPSPQILPPSVGDAGLR